MSSTFRWIFVGKSTLKACVIILVAAKFINLLDNLVLEHRREHNMLSLVLYLKGGMANLLLVNFLIDDCLYLEEEHVLCFNNHLHVSQKHGMCWDVHCFEDHESPPLN